MKTLLLIVVIECIVLHDYIYGSACLILFTSVATYFNPNLFSTQEEKLVVKGMGTFKKKCFLNIDYGPA